MCNSAVHQPFNGVIDPFSFSTIHFLRTCNRLMLPTDIHPYYSLTKENKPFECAADAGPLKHPPEIKKPEIPCPDVGKFFPISCQKDLPPTLPPSVTTSTCSPVGFDYPSEYPLSAHSRISDINYATLLNRRQRGEKRPIPEEQKDEKYYERRKRNNEAAKKSRDARKLREDRIAFRAAILEQENAILRAQLVALREEMTTLRQMMGTRPAQISVNL